jgi:hypothetical protein
MKLRERQSQYTLIGWKRQSKAWDWRGHRIGVLMDDCMDDTTF